MAESNNNRISRMLLSKERSAQYAKLFAVMAVCVAVAVAVALHQTGVAMTHKEQVLTCPVDGVVAHTHNESCYDKQGNLVCPLPERELHMHTDDCYTETRELICDQEESEDHKHTDDCYIVMRELTCGKEEATEEHVHGPGCFTTVEVNDAEDEQFEDLELLEGQDEKANTENSENKVLACPVKDVVAHKHDKSCYDKEGNLVCPLPEQELHKHTDDCYTETRELACGKEESKKHKHTDECYSVKRELTCGKKEITEEHVHGPECFKAVEEKDGIELEDVVAMPAQSFTGTLKDKKDKVVLKVEVEAPEGAFPAKTTMKIEALDSKDVQDAVDEAVAKKTDDKVTDVQAVDIKFFNEAGEEIEPAVDITVRFVSDVIAQNDNSYVVHVNKDGKGAVVDSLTEDQLADRNQKKADDELYIDANEFSPYVIVGTKALTTEVLLSDGKQYDVTVTYGEDAQIPEGATLSVKPFDKDSEEYKNARNAVIAGKQAKGESVDSSALGFAAVDISILDADGKEIEPAATVTVNLKIKKLPEVDDLKKVQDTLEIQHHVETEDGVVVETVADKSADATFDMATNEEVIKNGTVVDPNDANESPIVADADDTEVTFDTEVFSTFTITWSEYWTGNKSATIHYVDESGNELTIASSSANITTSSSPAFLIYDIDGYEYDYTYLNQKSTKIKPMLVWKNSRWNYVKNQDNYSTAELYDSYNIYVVYKKKTHTEGGKPSASSNEQWPTGDNAPQFFKSSTQNGDDTNTISLSIKAAEDEVDEYTKANVIVIFDLSNSMRDDMEGTLNSKTYYSDKSVDQINSKARLAVAGAAVKTLANSLMPSEGSKNVKMALISFSNKAKLEQDWTDNAFTFNSTVNGLHANTAGGTNWEAALKMADELANADSDAATFVVFVSDGDPTFRYTRGNYSDGEVDMWKNDSWSYYRDYSVFGTGQDTYDHNYGPALEVVKDIVSHNKNFYSVGVSNDPQRMKNLITDAGSGYYYPGSNADDLANAFKDIAKKIKNTLGFADVQITDGITELTHVDMKVMTNVDPNSFTYYRWGGKDNKYGADYAHKTEWTTRESDGCAAAEYSKQDGAVHWNMGEGFQLEDGVNYVVEFRAWPSQEAYDLVADLNNGIKEYAAGKENSITQNEREQIVEMTAPTATSPGQYELKTNTDQVYAKYKKSSKTGDTVSVAGDLMTAQKAETLQNLYLESMKLTIKKTFEDELTYKEAEGHGEDRPDAVTLVLNRRDAYTKAEGEDIYVKNAGGFTEYKALQSDGSKSSHIALDDSNNWTFTTYIAPGFILGGTNGTVLEPGYDYTITEPTVERHYELITEIVNPMVVDGVGQYIGDNDGNQSLTATNRVKSGIDVWKHVYSVDGKEIYPATEFTIKGRLLDKDGQPFTWSESDGGNATGAYNIYKRDGTQRVTKGHFASTANIELKLKAGEYARFINVPEGCTFEFYEVLTGSDYKLQSLEAIMQRREANGGGYVQEPNSLLAVKDEKAKLDATGIVGNRQYVVTFNNERLTPMTQTIRFRKVAQDMNYGLEGAEFTLKIGEETHTLKSDKDGNLYEKVGDEKQYEFELPMTSADAPYEMTETVAPDGYVKIDGPIRVFVHDSSVGAEKSNMQFTIEPPDDGDGTYIGTILIPNSAGEQLPATGGAGTTTIYAMGAALVGVAAFGLVSKKLRNNL